MDLKQCDVRECEALMKPNEAHQMNILGKVYDLCDHCYQQIKEWVDKTLMGGREMVDQLDVNTTSYTLTTSPPVDIGDIQEYTEAPGSWTPQPNNGTPNGGPHWGTYTNTVPKTMPYNAEAEIVYNKGPVWKPGKASSIVFPFVKQV